MLSSLPEALVAVYCNVSAEVLDKIFTELLPGLSYIGGPRLLTFWRFSSEADVETCFGCSAPRAKKGL